MLAKYLFYRLRDNIEKKKQVLSSLSFPCLLMSQGDLKACVPLLPTLGDPSGIEETHTLPLPLVCLLLYWFFSLAV